MIHENYLSMLKESLPEYVRLARIGITTKKDEEGGGLGYPSATLLLAVVDINGSHLRKRQGAEPYTVTVPGTAKPQAIKNEGDHFLALNSAYRGYATRLHDASPDQLGSARDWVAEYVASRVEKGRWKTKAA